MTQLIKTLLMGLDDFPVQIGVNSLIEKEHAHGIIHSIDASGRTVHVNFVADKPRRLKRPSQEQIASLFDQARKLGFDPKHIELRVGRPRSYNEVTLEAIALH